MVTIVMHMKHIYMYITYLHIYNYMYTHRYQQGLDIVGFKPPLSSSTPGPLPYTHDQEKWAECQELLARGECVCEGARARARERVD
jgi:hypothetical protein